MIADLPGYGWSDMPESDKDHTPYTKRAMAKAMIDAMEATGPCAVRACRARPRRPGGVSAGARSSRPAVAAGGARYPADL